MGSSKFEPVDMIAIFIVIVIGVFIFLSLFGVVFTGIPMDDAKARLISSIVTSLVSVISLYVGHRLGKNSSGTKRKK